MKNLIRSLERRKDSAQINEDNSFIGTFKKDCFGLSGRFMREKSQLKDLAKLVRHADMEFLNVFEEFEFAQTLTGMENISFAEVVGRLKS